jgi:site-specific recombinase XerD
MANASSERMELIDRSLRGLMLVKRKNGLAKWVLKYQCPRTFQNRSMPIGAFPEIQLHEARQKSLVIIREEYGSDQFELIKTSQDESKGMALEISEAKHEFSVSDQITTNENVRKVPFLDNQTGLIRDGLDALSMKISHLNPSFKSHRGLITLKQFYLDHYLPYIKVVKRSWATDVSVLTNHILPPLGGYTMVDLKPFMVQEMVQGLAHKGLSAATCNRALIILKYMYNCGLKWEVLPKMDNPCKNVKEMVMNNKKERFLNGYEIATLKFEISKSRNKFLAYIVQLLILTGCRRGEALNAQLQNFDLGRGDWVVPLPKAGKARHIPLNDVAIQTVRATIQFKQSYNQITRESNYLFPSPITGLPFKSVFYSWDKARRAANIETVRMHDLRHSFASAMVNSGMTLYDVKEILGHTHIKTTERYAHLSNTRLRHAAESVTSFYGKQEWLGEKVKTE